MTELEKQLFDALKHIFSAIERQLELIAERAPGQFLDKRPVVQALGSHARRANAAIAAAEAAEAAQPVEGASGERLAAEMALSQQLAARVNDLEHQLATAPAVPEAIDLLRTMEWLYKPYDDYSHAHAGYYCPECEEMRESGHRDDCKLLALLAAAPAPAQVEQQAPVKWQPISTAPKNGMHILCYMETEFGGHIEPIYWSDGCWNYCFDGDSCQYTPSHWMPSPPAPTQEAGARLAAEAQEGGAA